MWERIFTPFFSESSSKILSKRREGIQPWEQFPRMLTLRGILFCGHLPKLSAFHGDAAGRELDPAFLFFSRFSRPQGLSFHTLFLPVPLCLFLKSPLCLCFFFSSSVFILFTPTFLSSQPACPFSCLQENAPRPFHKILVTVQPALEGPYGWKAKVNVDT